MKVIHTNQVNGVLKARIKGLRAQLAESGYINHSSTKGTLREKYLAEFLKEVLPQSCTISGGFVCDVTGKISSQHDLILADHTTTPSMFLTADTSLVPVEIAISTIEIKSNLKNSDYEQINSQVSSTKSLQPIAGEDTKGTHGVRHFIFAYESQLSEESIKEWFQNISRLFGICVLGKEYYYRSSSKKIESIVDDDYAEVLIFVSSLIHSIMKAVSTRPTPSFILPDCSIACTKKAMTKKEETMFSLVVAWRESGKTRKEFCNTHNMKVSTFAYWITRKNKAEQDANCQGHEYSPPVFLPIDVSGSGHRTTSVDIHYPNGVRLTVPIDEETLIGDLIRLW